MSGELQYLTAKHMKLLSLAGSIFSVYGKAFTRLDTIVHIIRIRHRIIEVPTQTGYAELFLTYIFSTYNFIHHVNC